MIATAAQIDRAIGEVTGVAGVQAGVPNVWIYGEMLWANPTAFEFCVIRGHGPRDTREQRVTILTRSVKRYRDGDSPLFLIEMSRVMATIIGIEDFILNDTELEQKKRSIDTSRAW